jgi:hypothetical protein
MSHPASDPENPAAALALRLFDRLRDPALSQAEAEALFLAVDGHEAELALPLFARLRATRDPIELRAVSRLLGRWRDRPVARALVPALQTLLVEPGVADLNRMTAAGLLERLGEPVDYPPLLERIEDLQAVARDATYRALEASSNPASLAATLNQLARMPQDQVLAFVDDLADLGDGRAGPVLAALLHAASPDVAIAALAAIDALGLRSFDPSLARAGAHHWDAVVRRQATNLRERLAPTRPDAPREPASDADAPKPAIRALATLPTDTDSRILVLVTNSPGSAERVDLITIHLDATGIGRRDEAERLDPDGLARLVEGFEAMGLPLVDLGPAEARSVLEVATARSMAAGDLDQVGVIAWLLALDVD